MELNILDFQKFNILPYQGVGPIRFGMGRDELRDKLGEFSSFSHSRGNTDNFGYIKVEYDRDSCRAVMLNLPFEPIFKGKTLLKNGSINNLTKWLDSLNGILDIDIDGVKSYRFGIALSTESYNLFGNKRPNSMTVFRVGYFDDFASNETLEFRAKLNEVYRKNHNFIPDSINMDDF
jgi:hypothetical protein